MDDREEVSHYSNLIIEAVKKKSSGLEVYFLFKFSRVLRL